MKLTSAEELRRIQRESFDSAYLDTAYRRLQYAFGCRWEETSSFTRTSESAYPDFPDITCNYSEIGCSRNIYTTQAIVIQQGLATEPEPLFPDINPEIASLRAAFIMARRRGDPDWTPERRTKYQPAHGKWSSEDERVVGDGDGLGRGYLQIGLEDGASGFQRVTVRHSPFLYTMGDRMERNPKRWRHVTFVHLVPVDEAVRMFGSEVRKYQSSVYDDGSGWQGNDPVQCVKLLEHFNLGIGASGPTHAITPNGWDCKPLFIEENSFECLPLACYENIMHSGMRYPTGRIERQMPQEALINEVERLMMSKLRKRGFDIMDADKFDPKDIQKLKKGEPGLILALAQKMLKDDADPYQRIPDGEISATDINMYEIAQRSFAKESGVNEMKRGTGTDKSRTATEVSLIASESDSSDTWQMKRLAEYYAWQFEIVCQIAKKFDKAPLMLTTKEGDARLINDPAKPISSIENYMVQQSRILIDEESLRSRDAQIEQQRELAKLNPIAGLVQMGLVPGTYYAERVLQAIGEKNASSIIQDVAAMPQQTPVPAG